MAKWTGLGNSAGAPLPPTNLSNRDCTHNKRQKAGLNGDVYAKFANQVQRHMAEKDVSRISDIISRKGERRYFETFGVTDTEKTRTMSDVAVFRWMDLTKPVIALATLTIVDGGKVDPDNPISKCCSDGANRLI